MKNIHSTTLYKWFTEVWNNGNINAIEELMADQAVAHGIRDENSQRGPEGFKEFYNNFKSGFSNVNVTVEDVVSENDIEVARCKVTATQVPSGKPVEFSGLCMAKIEDGKIAEAWNQFDFLSMYQQLGQTLAPAQS